MNIEYEIVDNGTTQVAQIDLELSVEKMEYAHNNKSKIYDLLYTYGAILFKNSPVNNANEFEAFVSNISIHPYGEYREAATPRTQIHNSIFTSTDYPKEYSIYLHNENSHVTSWPNTLFFYCETPPGKGGETPIADCRRIYEKIDNGVIGTFEKLGFCYRRTYGYGLGIDWKTSFGVSSKEALASYLSNNMMKGSWKDDSHLEITYKRWASARHPITEEQIWFNHGLFFNVNNLSESQQEFAKEFGIERMPYHTLYGDGEEIPLDVISHLQACYDEARLAMPWNKRDILMIDNMLVCHGRNPYEGDRKILVAMTGTTSHENAVVFPQLKS